MTGEQEPAQVPWPALGSVRRLLVAQAATALMFAWPVMTLFFQARGLSFVQIGILSSVGGLVALGAEVPSGWLADRWGRRRSLTLGAAIMGGAMLGLLVSPRFLVLIVVEVVFSVGSSLLSGTDSAALYDSLAVAGRRADFTTVNARITAVAQLMRVVARLAGPALLAVWVLLPMGLSAVLYGVVIVCFATLGSDVEAKPAEMPSPGAGPPQGESPGGVRALLHHHRSFLLTALTGSLVLVVFSTYAQYSGPFLMSRGLSLGWTGPVFAVVGLVAMAGSMLLPRLRERLRLRPARLLLPVGLTIAAFSVIVGWLQGWLAAALVYAAMSFLWSVFAIALATSLNDAVGSGYRATALSVAALLDGVFAVVLDPVVGAALDHYGFDATYGVLGGAVVVAVLLVTLLGRAGRPVASAAPIV